MFVTLSLNKLVKVFLDKKVAECVFTGEGVGNVSGSVRIEEDTREEWSVFTVTVSGLSPGKHGFHVHERGDLSNNCKGAGGHFNPLKVGKINDRLTFF